MSSIRVALYPLVRTTLSVASRSLVLDSCCVCAISADITDWLVCVKCRGTASEQLGNSRAVTAPVADGSRLGDRMGRPAPDRPPVFDLWRSLRDSNPCYSLERDAMVSGAVHAHSEKCGNYRV